MSIFKISRMTFTYMWSKGVFASGVHVTGVISFTLVNNWETVDWHFIVFASNNLLLLKLLCLMLRHWYSMQAIIDLLFSHSIVDSSNIPLAFLGEKELNIVPWRVCNYSTWARVSIPSKSFFASAIIKSNSIGAVSIFVTNVIDAFAFIDVWLKINRKKKLRQGEKILQKGSVKVNQTLCKVILFLICWLTSQVHVAINQLWTPDISWIQPVLFTDAVFTFT